MDRGINFASDKLGMSLLVQSKPFHDGIAPSIGVKLMAYVEVNGNGRYKALAVQSEESHRAAREIAGHARSVAASAAAALAIS